MTSTVLPATQVTQSKPTASNLIDQVIEAALARLGGKVQDIKAQALDDEDQNHKITLVTSEGEEKASLFALNLPEYVNDFQGVTDRLTKKLEDHLRNKKDPNFVQLPSGAMILPQADVSIEIQNGYLMINGKKIAVEGKDGNFSLDAAMVQTYTLLIAQKEGDLLILSDDYDKIRHDGKEGFIFNPHSTVLIDNEEHLILYRTREAAKKS